MNVLVTGGAGQLAQAIVRELTPEHHVRVVESSPVETPESVEFVRADILDLEQAWAIMRGMDAVIHTGDPPPNLPKDPSERDEEILDFKTRGTHNVMHVAVDAGIKKLIYASSLAPMRSYPDDVTVTELWKPRPSLDMWEMATYLGELTTREFARDYLVTATGLRLGDLVVEEDVAAQPPNLMWLDIRDAARAFRGALERDVSQSPAWQQRWAIYHIVADVTNPKFLISAAQREIGYRPEHNFRSHFAAA